MIKNKELIEKINPLFLENKKETKSIYDLNKTDCTICDIDFKKKTTDAINITELEYIAIFPDGVCYNEGGVLTKNGYVITDFQTSPLNNQHKLLNQECDINAQKKEYFDGKLAIISSPGSENYYHWLLQVLPRLIILSESNIEYDKIYINNLKYEWQEKSLIDVLFYLKIDKDRILIKNGDMAIQAKELIVPSIPLIPSKDIQLKSWTKEILNDIFLKNTKDLNLDCSEKIYISRNKASVRKIENEDQLINEFKEQNFDILYLEDISPKQGAYNFSKAKIIVTPHGSALANLIFIQNGCKLVEIDHKILDASYDQQRSFFKSFAKQNGGLYYPYYSDCITEKDLENNISVDSTDFMKFINIIENNGDHKEFILNTVSLTNETIYFQP